MKRHVILASVVLLSGCATLLNSNRPSYNGPIVKPVWHNSSLWVDRPPVIQNGVVYAAGHPWDARDYRRTFAFDLKTGRQLWVSDLPAEKIMLATESIVFVQSLGVAELHTLDAKTGKDVSLVYRVSFQNAALVDGILFTTSGGWVEARSMATYLKEIETQSRSERSKTLWQTHIPTDASLGTAPAVAGGTVYVSSFQKFQLEPRRRASSAVYAIDGKTGAIRWTWQSDDSKAAPTPYGIAADSSTVYVWLHDTSKDVIGSGTLLALDAATGSEKWRHSTSIYVHSCPAPLLINPAAVLACDYPPGPSGTAFETGFLYQRFNRQTGQKISESQTGWKYENYVHADGILFGSDHKVHEVFNENNDSSPDSWLSAVSLETGKELWRSETIELGILTLPAAAGGMVVVGSEPFHRESPRRDGGREVSGLWAYSIVPR